jgi:hypothetical protein
MKLRDQCKRLLGDVYALQSDEAGNYKASVGIDGCKIEIELVQYIVPMKAEIGYSVTSKEKDGHRGIYTATSETGTAVCADVWEAFRWIVSQRGTGRKCHCGCAGDDGTNRSDSREVVTPVGLHGTEGSEDSAGRQSKTIDCNARENLAPITTMRRSAPAEAVVL